MMNALIKRIDPALIRLYRYLAPYRWKLLLAAIFLIGSASTSSLTATLLGKLTDLGFYQGEKWIIYAAPAALLGVSLLFAVCSVCSSYVMTDVSQSVLVRIREEMFRSILRWPNREYQDHTTGSVSSKFVNEASMALGGATQSLSTLVRDSIQVLALLCVLFYYNWQLTLVTFLIGPGLVFILRRISKRVRKIVKENQETLGRMISRVQETYEAEKLVKISNTYDFEDQRFDAVSGKIEKLTLKTIKMSSISTPATQLLTMVAIAFVVAVALIQAQQGLLTIGEFITFLSAMLLMKAPIQHLAGLNATFANISVAAKSIFEILDTVPEKDEGTRTIKRAKGEFEFNHVFLRYPGQTDDALKDINLRVKSGEHIALVGLSGSGKSSLVNLIPRYWEPTYGTILLDGIDIRELTLENLRKQIAIVSQEIVLLDDTIRNNILYGCEHVTVEKLHQAICGAALEDFIACLPKGLDTPVGEAGNLLSGGQKQRISIARAILKDAPVLILDEATSALDSKNEFLIKEALEKLTLGKTSFTVAHRLGTIENVDRIIVLNDGEIVESGTSEELLKLDNGIYRKISHMQGII
jgi:subfamily B ATP-binding cassette protein MsbA